MADAQVAVHTDTCEEEDAAVQIGIEQEAHYFAQGFTKGPVVAVGIIVNERWKRQHVEHV